MSERERERAGCFAIPPHFILGHKTQKLVRLHSIARYRQVCGSMTLKKTGNLKVQWVRRHYPSYFHFAKVTQNRIEKDELGGYP